MVLYHSSIFIFIIKNTILWHLTNLRNQSIILNPHTGTHKKYKAMFKRSNLLIKTGKVKRIILKGRRMKRPMLKRRRLKRIMIKKIRGKRQKIKKLRVNSLIIKRGNNRKIEKEGVNNLKMKKERIISNLNRIGPRILQSQNKGYKKKKFLRWKKKRKKDKKWKKVLKRLKS